jgi:diguanylate cyclase (GGDEF)-like protein
VRIRRARHLRLIEDETPKPMITSEGRPEEGRPPIMWGSILVRLLSIGWGVAVIAALVDAFGVVPHIPLFTAMGMTGLLVAGVFVLTHNGVPDWRGDAAPVRQADEEGRHAMDLLTNLPTFAFFQRRLVEEFGRSRRMGKLVSVVLIDVNNLTAVNKEYGVRAGDEVLRHVASAVDSTRRYNDVVARLGDDEFGVLLMDCGDEGVKAFIDRLEDRLARESAVADVDGRVISLWAGVCSGTGTSEPSMEQGDELLALAMSNLNGAKVDRERRRRMWLSA